MQVTPDNDEDEDDDDQCKPAAGGFSNLEKLLQRHHRHEDDLVEPWRAEVQQIRDGAGNERPDREDNERRHRQTQRIAWISLATAVVAVVISVLT